MHAESVACDPTAIRWAVPEASLPGGLLRAAPGEFGVLLGGPVERILLEAHAVVVWLREGEDWDRWGERVQSALSRALPLWEQWRIEPSGEVVDFVLRDVLAGPSGDYIRGHGGEVRLAGLQGGSAQIAFAGACARCPALEVTLTGHLESALRERCPGIERVVAVRSEGARRRSRVLPWPGRKGG